MSKRNDISQQIRKYLNGELDTRAMHRLEKEAQNDPFLMEALEGYENSKPDQQKNIDEINARLQARINKNEGRIIPWRIISIAASVLIILSVGGLFIRNYRPDVKPKAIALADKLKAAPPVTKVEPKTEPVIAANKPKMFSPKMPHAVYEPALSKNQKTAVVENPPAAADITASPSAAITFKDTTKLVAVNVVGYAAKRKASVTNSVQSIPADAFYKKDAKIENRLAGKVAGVTVNPAPANNQLAEIVIRGLAPAGKTNELAYSTATVTPGALASVGIKGIIKDESGNPIPGATVRIKGTSLGTYTNGSGYFKLDSVPNKPVLDINFIGYESRQVKANKRDSLVIAMQPNNQSLNEVVVVGYGKQRPADQSAQPANGWSGFKKYLKDNAESPDGKTGTVKLSFMVNADNSLSDFKIIKGISAKTDSAAIELVNDGPNWHRNTNGKPEKVKLKIKFTGKQ